MVQETIGDDNKLQLHMIRLLINAKDAKEGLYWAKKFDIPKEQWPWAITYEDEHIESEGNNLFFTFQYHLYKTILFNYKGINEGASTSRINVNSDELTEDINCHELKLARNSIKIIDSPRSFEEFIDNGLNGVYVVGIDSEWKPCFGNISS